MREYESKQKQFQQAMRDPGQVRAFKAAVKEYQKQFNDDVEVQIHNGREAQELDLHTNGFVLLEHLSAVNDWGDEHLLEEVYHSEMREVVQGLTGASRCYVGRHNIRKSDGSTAFGPFLEVHSDFTDKYKDALVRSLQIGEEQTPTFGILGKMQQDGLTASELESSRVMMLHVWRSVSDEPLRCAPLAVCDGRTFAKEDLIRETVRGLERYRALYNPSHRWFWFPEMSKNEVLIFKGYDSKCDRYAFHSAFMHPDVGPDTAVRFSCELRVLCLTPE